MCCSRTYPSNPQSISGRQPFFLAYLKCLRPALTPGYFCHAEDSRCGRFPGSWGLLLQSLHTALWQREAEGWSEFCSLAGHIIFVSGLLDILPLLGFLKFQDRSWGPSRQGSHLGDFHGFLVFFHLVLNAGPCLSLQNSLAGCHTCRHSLSPPPRVLHLCCVLESPRLCCSQPRAS